MDEKGFVLGKGARSCVLVRASNRSINCQRKIAGNKDFVIVIKTVSAAGGWLSPTVIFKTKNQQQS